MKTKTIILAIAALFFLKFAAAQNRTTVTANSDDISDNLDLRVIASVFGEAENLEDFERRLNDPELRISNLDLNGDNRVDYLRVIESVEGTAHLIIIQAVIGVDLYQDVATIEVEKDNQNQPRILVVGDVFMYGDNYIYEPVYYQTPLLYNYFWNVGYRPYFSSWYWGYYPTYFSPWAPLSVYHYLNFISIHINHQNYYNCISYRPQNHRAYLISRPYRGNAFATMHPNRAFHVRNSGIQNKHILENIRRDNPRKNAPVKRNELYTPRRDQNKSREQVPSRTNTRTRADLNLNNHAPSRNEFSEVSGSGKQVTLTSPRASFNHLNSNNLNNGRVKNTEFVNTTRSNLSSLKNQPQANKNSEGRTTTQPQRSFNSASKVSEAPQKTIVERGSQNARSNYNSPRETTNSVRRGAGGR